MRTCYSDRGAACSLLLLETRWDPEIVSDGNTTVLQLTGVGDLYQFVRFLVSLSIKDTERVDDRIKDRTGQFALGYKEIYGTFSVQAERSSKGEPRQLWKLLWTYALPEPTDQWNYAITTKKNDGKKKSNSGGQPAVKYIPNVKPSQSIADGMATSEQSNANPAANAEAQTRADIARAEAEAKANTAKAEAELKAEVAKAEAEARANTAKAEAEAKVEVAKAEAEAKASVAKAEAEAHADVAKAQAQSNTDIAKAQAQANAEIVASQTKSNADMADKWTKAFKDLTIASKHNNQLQAASFARMNEKAAYDTAVLASAFQNVTNNAAYNNQMTANIL